MGKGMAVCRSLRFLGKGKQSHCVVAVRHGDRMQGEANWGQIVKRGGAGLIGNLCLTS